MAKSVPAEVTPEVLVWARKTVNQGTDEAAHGLHVDEALLKQWEAGALKPTIAQLKKIANYYKRPMATFYLPKPPDDIRPPKDFRRSSENMGKPYSKALNLAFRFAELRQDFARDFRQSEGFKPLAFVGSVSMRTSASDLAATTRRDLLKVDLDTQFDWESPREGMHEWTAALEGLDILVFQTSGVSTHEMRGFSLQDKIAPVIAANPKDVPAARSFTMMHELCHLLLDNPGVCDLEEKARDTSDENRIEVYCNAFAGHLLVPGDALLQAIRAWDTGRTREWTNEELKTLALKFKVSREVILRRLLSMGRATETLYERKRQEFIAEYEALLLAKKTSGKPGGFLRPHQKSVRDNGRSFIRMALEAYQEEKITGNELLDYLGVKMEFLRGIREEL